jgi:hypothetical protein
MRGRAGTAISSLRNTLDESLFPIQPPGSSSLGRAERGVVVIALLALAIVAQLFRAGPSYALNTVWAEDGGAFLQGAIHSGILSTVFTPYAGYLVLVPRLIGDVGALVPLHDAPAAIALVSAAVVALCGFVVWYAAAAHLPNRYLRGTLAAATVLAPVASLEAVTSGTYVAWYMLFATFWILLWRPRTVAGAVCGGLFVLATALSSPGVWYFAPLVALRLLALRDRRDLTIVGSYVIGTAVQVPVLMHNASEVPVDPQWSRDIWTAYFQRVVDGGIFGENFGGSLWTSFGWTFLIVLLLAVFAGLVIGFVRASTPARWFAAVAVPTSVVMFLGSAYQRAAGPVLKWPGGISYGLGGRYAIVPALLLVAAALVLTGRTRAGPRLGLGSQPWPGLAVAAVVLIAVSSSLVVEEGVSRGTPPWDDALQSASYACRAKDLTEVTVKISPPTWGVILPCREVLDAEGASAAR